MFEFFNSSYPFEKFTFQFHENFPAHDLFVYFLFSRLA